MWLMDSNVVPWGVPMSVTTLRESYMAEQHLHEAPKLDVSSSGSDTEMTSDAETASTATEVAATSLESNSIPESALLNLPLEIRLQIYGWIHLMHPVQHAQLAPWYPTPFYSAYFLKAIESKQDEEAGSKANEASERDRPRLLSADRPLAGIPSRFLIANKQIYEENKTIPFHENEFVFVNWFSSGLWAARAFTKALKPWQKVAMRHVRLEMLGRDFTGPGLREWISLCNLWAEGLRGLRLKILIGGGIFEPNVGFDELNHNAESRAMDIFHQPEPEPEWIEQGLRQMKALKSLEVELSVMDWDAEKKLAWCAALDKMLNARKEAGEAKISVLCVERVMQNSEPDKSDAGCKTS